jgi:RNA polymerase sigma-70 factor (ECF subfamily)
VSNRLGAASQGEAPLGAASPGREGSAAVDRELDRLWLQGDPRAFERAHLRYRARLEGVAYRILRDRSDAEDVVQRVFVALRRAAYRGSASLWTYLYRSAVNGAVNVLRSRRRREAAERRLLQQEILAAPHRAPASPEAKILEGEILAAVAKALIHVKPQHRRVLVLRILHGLTNTEIAEREELPLATVGTWLRRGREELRRGLAPVLRDMGRTP